MGTETHKSTPAREVDGAGVEAVLLVTGTSQPQQTLYVEVDHRECDARHIPRRYGVDSFTHILERFRGFLGRLEICVGSDSNDRHDDIQVPDIRTRFHTSCGDAQSTMWVGAAVPPPSKVEDR